MCSSNFLTEYESIKWLNDVKNKYHNTWASVTTNTYNNILDEKTLKRAYSLKKKVFKTTIKFSVVAIQNYSPQQ